MNAPEDGWFTEDEMVERARDADDMVARRMSTMIRPETAREVLSRAEHRCDICRATWPAGSVMWTGKQSFKAGRKWHSVYVCQFCPTPLVPNVVVSRDRLETHVNATTKRERGRPFVFLTTSEKTLVSELRATGLGEMRLAREFRARTGKRVSPRTLARFGRA